MQVQLFVKKNPNSYHSKIYYSKKNKNNSVCNFTRSFMAGLHQMRSEAERRIAKQLFGLVKFDSYN